MTDCRSEKHWREGMIKISGFFVGMNIFFCQGMLGSEIQILNQV